MVYHLVKDFDIVTNIRRADVKADHGWMVLEIEAAEERLEQGVAWLKEQGVKVDPIERDVVVPRGQVEIQVAAVTLSYFKT